MIGHKRPRVSSFNTPGASPFLSMDGEAGHVRVEALFQPDILSSFQYQATQRRRFHLEPEKVLMLAVLEDAIVCFQDNLNATCKRKQTLHLDAEQWILDQDKSYLFSFENICEALNFDPAYLREGLVSWKEAKLAGQVKTPRKQLASWKRQKVTEENSDARQI
jgi:hypothetical protein